MSEPEREIFKHAVFIEESHHVLSNERLSLLGGQSVMDLTFREIREFGECLVLFDQHPSQISLPALGNTYTTICLNLKHAKDVSTMAQAMLLDGEEKDLLGSLEVGQAVVKVQGRVSRAFRIRIPAFPIEKGRISDRAVELRMSPVLASPASLIGTKPTEADRINKVLPEADAVPDLQMHFLQDVKDSPESGIAARYKRLGLSVRQGQKLKRCLLDTGLITETQELTQTGRLNRIRLTEKGERMLAKARNSLSEPQE